MQDHRDFARALRERPPRDKPSRVLNMMILLSQTAPILAACALYNMSSFAFYHRQRCQCRPAQDVIVAVSSMSDFLHYYPVRASLENPRTFLARIEGPLAESPGRNASVVADS